MPVSALICFCTCPDADSAGRIAETLVAERLAACVNVLPGLLLIKTQTRLLQRLQERLLQLHPYELPELVAVETDLGLPEYLRWIADETRPESPTE